MPSVAPNAPQPAAGDPWWAPSPISLLGAFLLDGAVATELGDASEALRAGTGLDTSSLTSLRDGPAWNHIRVARAYDAKRNPEAALHRLLEAELIAPELTRNHAMVREMVSAMLHRREGRSATPGLRELADRVGVLN